MKCDQLTLSWRRPLSCRNQSIDLLGKSMDWFLFDNDLRHERVNQFFSFGMVAITKTQVTFFSNVEATREKSAIWWQYSIYL